MNRRKFFAFLPVAPLALIAQGAIAATADGAPIQETTKVTLCAAKKKETSKSPFLAYREHNTIMFNSMSTNDDSKQVSLAVGDDGNLWLKRKDGDWRKVVTQSYEFS